MRIKLWGVRGSLPSPVSGEIIKRKIQRALTLAKPGDITSEESINSFIKSLPFSIQSTFGGNTTSIQVETGAGDQILIDCGSGLRMLGHELMKGRFGEGKGIASVLLTHTHWDHIQGIPFFLPFYVEGNRFNFYSALPDLKARLEYQQAFTHFPISFDFYKATKEFFTVSAEEDLYINDTKIVNKLMPHPGPTFGYRIEDKGKSFVFTSDCEFNINEIDNIQNFRTFFSDADVAVFDTQYTFEDSIDKLDFGHSSAAIAIDIAGMFNIKRLILFHHDPNYDDEKLESVLFNAKTYLSMNAARVGDTRLDIAYEGMEIEL